MKFGVRRPSRSFFFRLFLKLGIFFIFIIVKKKEQKGIGVKILYSLDIT